MLEGSEIVKVKKKQQQKNKQNKKTNTLNCDFISLFFSFVTHGELYHLSHSSLQSDSTWAWKTRLFSAYYFRPKQNLNIKLNQLLIDTLFGHLSLVNMLKNSKNDLFSWVFQLWTRILRKIIIFLKKSTLPRQSMIHI